MGKLWGGRFKKPLDPLAVALSYSLHFDHVLFQYDVEINAAHAEGLYHVGVLTKTELANTQKGLTAVVARVVADPSLLKGDDEDVHSLVERLLVDEVGDLGKKIHTGKSRNDQSLTGTRMALKVAIKAVVEDLDALMGCLVSLAKESTHVIFPGFTHFQVAQPVLLAHHFLAYVEMLSRDRNRFELAFKAADVCPLGAGALAGNGFGIHREAVAKRLGFSSVTQNSMDSVADRDFILDFFHAASTMMLHLSRFCEELILWSSPVLGFIEIGDDFTTGSSMMPQKKNPDVAELIRGKSGRVLGHFVALHHLIKGLPLTYNRDFQEDKEPLFDTISTLQKVLPAFTGMLNSVVFKEAKINEALGRGFILATELADYLVKKGVSFRNAHELTGQIVSYAESTEKPLESLTLDEFHRICPEIKSDIYLALDLKAAIKSKDSTGGTSWNQVHHQMSKMEFKQKKEI